MPLAFLPNIVDEFVLPKLLLARLFIAVPFFHFAHRLRYLLVDFGFPGAKGLWAQVGFYGTAVAVTIVTIWLLLTVAPLNFRALLP